TSSNGYDIIFTSDSACTVKLSHEIENYTAATGAVSMWVKVPSITSSADTTIYLCYRNSAITTSQEDITNVWDSNYLGVYHLPNGASLTANDSTSNGYNLTVSSATATTGQISGGAYFNGTTAQLTESSMTISAGSSIAISYWTRVNSADVSNS